MVTEHAVCAVFFHTVALLHVSVVLFEYMVSAHCTFNLHVKAVWIQKKVGLLRICLCFATLVIHLWDAPSHAFKLLGEISLL